MATAVAVEHLDVLIVGAGLSGVGAACHLKHRSPQKSFAVLEARDAIGGTWDLFRYPGIRSDSDMFTLGYSFRPWKEARAIADGPAILDYIRDTARDHGIEDAIRLNHRVVRAAWSSDEARWTVDVERTDTNETFQLTCNFLLGCVGYYRYDEGYTPEFAGTERFGGQIVHPQHWPEDLDYAGKRVVVIGSGATAVTLVPAMSARAAHVTMLQRSPTYIVALPGEDPVAKVLLKILPTKVAYTILRWFHVGMTTFSFVLSRKRPKWAKALIRAGVKRRLPKGYDVDTHFRPKYDPWTQRMCLVPDGDLFKAISDGSASVVTDEIETFTETGLRLRSGTDLDADIIITATGLNLQIAGGMDLVVDGREIAYPDLVGYKGIMFSGVPNVAIVVGYTNASWTLKCDLTCAYVCRLLNHMDAHGYASATPRAPGPEIALMPFIDLSAGYVLRNVDKFPRQADQVPWRLFQNYPRDIRLLGKGPVDDEIDFAPAPRAGASYGSINPVRTA